MTNNNSQTDLDLDDDESNEDNGPSAIRARIKQLEKENRRLAALEPENASLKTSIAIRDAKLNLSDIQTKALLASHEGDTSPELLRKTAEALGFAQPEAEHDAGDEETQRQLDEVRKGAQSPAGGPTYEEEIAAAQTKQEVIEIAAKHGMPVEV